jgi:PAS domain-containing protein
MQTANKPQSTYLKAYSIAVLVSSLCVLFTFAFLPVFDRGTLHIFYIAVLIVAWRGGVGPALFTIAVGALTNVFLLMSPSFNAEITAEDWLRVGIFILASLFIAYIAYQLEQSKRDLQKSLETERESLARSRAVINSVNEALALVSPEQRIININQRFEEIFGIPRERVVGQLLSDTQTMFDQIFADADQSYELN